MNRNKKVVVIGGGVAGMQSAIRLTQRGVDVVIVERDEVLGGKLNGWYHLFPSLTPAKDVVAELCQKVAGLGVEVRCGESVESFTSSEVVLQGGDKIACDAVVVASGFKLFDARIKEEYGYGIYPNVITSADLETMLREGRFAKADGTMPRRVALLHCVGSRDQKVAQGHCSKVCCVTGVKQAMEIKKLVPDADIFNFYMDIRMFGPGYEEMYRRAQQECNVHFVRGRISEASVTFDDHIQIKAEDTLTGRPLRMSVDMLVLLVGMCAESQNEKFDRQCGLKRAESGFMAPKDLFTQSCKSSQEGVFYAGAVTAPKNVGESIGDGDVVANAICDYFGA